MADWGIKISKPGFDVKTCENKDLIMNSELATIKVAYSAAPTASGTYNHGLSYVPAFFVSGAFGFTEEVTQFAFVGQEFSSFEATYYCTSSYFYYYGPCRFFLFFQDTI